MSATRLASSPAAAPSGSSSCSGSSPSAMLVAARLQARRRHQRRDRELPARGRRVDRGPGAAQGPLPRRRDEHRADRLPARGRAHRGRPAQDRRGRAGASTTAIPVTAARAGAVRAGRAAGPRLRRTATPPTRSSRSRSTSTRSPTGARRRATSIGGGGGGLEVYVTGDLGLFADFEEVFGELDAKLLLRDGPARADPARRDLPRAADRGHPDRRRRRSPTRSPAASSTCTPTPGNTVNSQLDRHPRRADVRRRHRLLPAARQPLPRGAAPHRGQARGDGARAAPRRARRCWPAAAR